MNPDARLPLGDTVDVRPRNEFRVGHFASAISSPLDELSDHLHRLPNRDRKLWVFGAVDEVAEAVTRLTDRGYTAVTAHPAAGSYASPEGHFDSPWIGGEERVRLWQPAAFLVEVLSELGAPVGGTALDIACGSGRNTCWLALAGWQSHGVDALPDALARALDLSRGCARALEARRTSSLAAAELDTTPFRPPRWLEADIEKAWPFRDSSFDLVSGFRFLWRPLLPRLVTALRPGGSLVYETFTRRQAEFGKPRRSGHLLAEGELRQRVLELGLEVREYRERCPPGGPALASLWAVREPGKTPGPQAG